MVRLPFFRQMSQDQDIAGRSVRIMRLRHAGGFSCSACATRAVFHAPPAPPIPPSSRPSLNRSVSSFPMPEPENAYAGRHHAYPGTRPRKRVCGKASRIPGNPSPKTRMREGITHTREPVPENARSALSGSGVLPTRTWCKSEAGNSTLPPAFNAFHGILDICSLYQKRFSISTMPASKAAVMSTMIPGTGAKTSIRVATGGPHHAPHQVCKHVFGIRQHPVRDEAGTAVSANRRTLNPIPYPEPRVRDRIPFYDILFCM